MIILGETKGVAIVEWLASPAGDVIADSAVALLMHAQSSAASIRLTSKPCRHPRDPDADVQGKKKSKATDSVMERLRFLYATLKDQFQNVEASYEGTRGVFEITTDSGLDADMSDEDGTLTCTVTIQLHGLSATAAQISVESRDEKLAANVRACLQHVVVATMPIET